jgi:hypothetical protein
MLHISEIQKRGSEAPGTKQGHWPTPRAPEAVFAFSLQPSSSRFLDLTSGQTKVVGETWKDTTTTDGKYAPNFVREVIRVREAVTQHQRLMRERTSRLYFCNLVEITCVFSRSRQAYIPESCFLSVHSPCPLCSLPLSEFHLPAFLGNHLNIK